MSNSPSPSANLAAELDPDAIFLAQCRNCAHNILMHNLGNLIFLVDPNMFPRLYRFVIADQNRVRLVLQGRLNQDIINEAHRLDSIANGEDDPDDGINIAERQSGQNLDLSN